MAKHDDETTKSVGRRNFLKSAAAGAATALTSGTAVAQQTTPAAARSGIARPTEADARRAFDALADGGSVEMPLGKTFWSPCFGMVTDRFGLGWMVTVPQAPAS